jgi:uncharacterized protein YceK
MKRLRVLALGMAVLLCCAGCGSINDITRGDDGQRVYGGVRQDANMISNSNSSTPKVLGVLDFPFSFVLDTVFLPVTVIFAIARAK